MKISIVTPVLNDTRVARALDSILCQSHDHQLELIVVDGGSTDGTLEILEGYRDRITTLISEPDDGIYDAMNKGIQRSTGDVIGILNADDLYADLYVIQDVMDTLKDKKISATYGDEIRVDQNDEVVRYWNAGISRVRRWFQGQILPPWAPPHPTFFVRRSVYERYGLFRLDIPISADIELMVRLIHKHRITLMYIDRALVRFTAGGWSSHQRHGKVKTNSEIVYVWRLNYKYRWLLFLATRPLYDMIIAPIGKPILSLYRQFTGKRRCAHPRTAK